MSEGRELRHLVEVGASFVRRQRRAACTVVCGATALAGAGYGIDILATLPPGPPPPVSNVHIAGASELIADGSAWQERVTLTVPYTGLTPEPVSVGIERVIGWHTTDDLTNCAGDPMTDATPRSCISDTQDITAGASLLSVSGARRVGDTASLGTMRRGEVRTIVLTYRVPRSDAQRLHAHMARRVKDTFYNYVDAVTAEAVVTAGPTQIRTAAWTELGG